MIHNHSHHTFQTSSASDDVRYNALAFEKLFRENFTPLCTFCQFRFGFEPDQAKDIVHAGFLKLWETDASLSSVQPIVPYLYKIVANLCLDTIKHRKIKQQHELRVLQKDRRAVSGNSFEGVELKQLVAEINQAVTGMPEQMRKVFTLCRYEGLKYTEVASLLNMSVKTVETHMSRALARIRLKLAAYLVLVIIFTCLV